MTIHLTHPSLVKARKLATFLDSAVTIPVIRQKIGLDPILGAIPMAGEIVTLAMSSYMLWVAYELGLPRIVFVKLLGNILFDTLIGLVPLWGDIADAFWKANLRNVEILEEAYLQYGDRSGTRRAAQDVVIDVAAEAI